MRYFVKTDDSDKVVANYRVDDDHTTEVLKSDGTWGPSTAVTVLDLDGLGGDIYPEVDAPVEKHLGPGPHPDGSPQSVHGRKKGGTTQPPPTTPKQPQPQQQAPKQQTLTQQGEAGTVHNPIRTNDVREAAALLAEGKHVEFTQPRQVSTLISRLGKIARDMEKKGDKAPNFDLCKVTVKGLNLFCVESKGLRRIQMPQFSGQALPGSRAEQYVNDQGEADVGPAFADYLRDQGIGVEETAELASHLKASQMELVGKKVSGMMGAYRAGKLTESPIFVSSDNYVIDGHHRWATMIGVDLEDNVAGDLKMPVTRVDMPVTELLFASKLFTEQIMGIAPKVAKHYGPGPHKDGTPQSVHGNWARGLSANQRVGELRTQAESGQDVGFSIHYPSGVRPRHGWMVSLKGHEGRFKMSKLTKRNVRRFVRENIGVLKLKSTSFGAWLDGDEITFDVSMNVPDEATATKIGNENDQDAIWNLDTGKEKRLKVAA